jgi:hypothetical protein
MPDRLMKRWQSLAQLSILTSIITVLLIVFSNHQKITANLLILSEELIWKKFSQQWVTRAIDLLIITILIKCEHFLDPIE